MLLDLSEIFVCPRCRPTQGLVVLVDELRDRRVVRGHLGCPSCEARYPVDRGVLRFDAPADTAAGSADAADGTAAAGGGPGGPDAGPEDEPGEPEEVPGGVELFGGASAGEAALRVAALLGLPEAEGPFLLHPGLAGLAGALAETAEGEEVLALAEADSGGRAGAADRASDGEGDDGDAPIRARDEPGPPVTRIVGVPASDLPVFSGRLGGAAMLGGSPGALEESVRTLREGARVVVVEPSAGLREGIDGLPAEIVAADTRALVAVRRG